MPNYREAPITGKVWTRAVRVVCDNPLGGMPTINFIEERAIRFDSTTTVMEPAGCVSLDMSAPGTTFAVLDPETGDPTGEVKTYADVYAILHSIYMHAAAIRDGA